MTDFGRRFGDMLKSVYDTDNSGLVDTCETAPAHKTSHQDGGADEISVDGLSGTLADPQPVDPHDLAGSDHNAATLAELNAKVSDATLDKTTDTRTPSAHAASHENGGADELDLTGLSGSGQIVDRGDPSADDFTVSSFTTDNTWRDLDLSAIVPAGATAVILKVGVNDDAPASQISFRKNGNSNNLNAPTLQTQAANLSNFAQLIVFCDANRVIEYKADDLAFVAINVLVLGWFT